MAIAGDCKGASEWEQGKGGVCVAGAVGGDGCRCRLSLGTRQGWMEFVLVGQWEEMAVAADSELEWD